jgi:hypothetical protein
MRMGEDHLLDLARVDVRAPRDDHVLRPVGEREVALRVEPPDIARQEPAADERLRRGRRVLPIARHHRAAAHHDLAGLARGEVSPRPVSDRDLDRRLRTTDRAQPLAPAGMASVGDILPRQRRDSHRAFALPVDLDEPGPEPVHRLDDVGEIHGASAIDDGAEAGSPVAPRAGRIGEAAQHRRRHEHRQGAEAGGEVEDLARVEPARRRADVTAAPQHMDEGL